MIGIMAVATALVARKSASAETEPLLGLSRLVLVAAAIPALSMIIQVVPFGYVNCQSDLGNYPTGAWLAIVGSIGIDTGVGFLGLIQYISAIAILLVAMGGTRDESRADGVLLP